jgi:hypothetical protein
MAHTDDADCLRFQFCDAAEAGDIPGMKSYLDNTFPTDNSRMGVMIMAFSVAVLKGKQEAVDLLVNYTDEASLPPPMLESLAAAQGGDAGVKMYRAAVAKQQPLV